MDYGVGKDKALSLVNTCESKARKQQEMYFSIWRGAVEAFEGRTVADDPFSTNITVNHLLSTVETVVPRDVKALLGTRPYIPIRARSRENEDWAKAIERVADEQLDLAGFFEFFTDAFRIARATGNSFIEPFWDAYEELYSEVLRYINPMTGEEIPIGKQVKSKITEQLGFKVWGPWDIFVDPFGESLDQKKYIIIKQLTHVDDIQNMMDIQGTGYKKYTKEQLRKGGIRNDEFTSLLEKDKSCVNENNPDVGMLMRFQSNDRYIDVWNYSMVLRDVDNPHTNMPKHIKPLIHFRDVTEIGPRRFWGKGIWEQIGQLSQLGDDILSEVFDQIMMSRAQWLMYNPDMVAPEDLDAVYGNRVPVPGGRFDQAVAPIQLGQPDDRGFNMYDIVRGFIDYQTSISVYQRGGTAPRREAALTTQVLKAAGDEKLEFGVRYFEGTAMTRLAYLVTKTIDANMSTSDIADIIGWEMAMMIPSMDPTAMPGGYEFAFNGSERVVQITQKLEKFGQWWNLVANDPALADRVTPLREFTRMLDVFPRDKIDAMFPSPEQAPEQQVIQDQMRANAAGMGGEQGGGVQSVGTTSAVQNPRYGDQSESNVEMNKTE